MAPRYLYWRPPGYLPVLEASWVPTSAGGLLGTTVGTSLGTLFDPIFRTRVMETGPVLGSNRVMNGS